MAVALAQMGSIPSVARGSGIVLLRAAAASCCVAPRQNSTVGLTSSQFLISRRHSEGTNPDQASFTPAAASESAARRKAGASSQLAPVERSNVAATQMDGSPPCIFHGSNRLGQHPRRTGLLDPVRLLGRPNLPRSAHGFALAAQITFCASVRRFPGLAVVRSLHPYCSYNKA